MEERSEPRSTVFEEGQIACEGDAAPRICVVTDRSTRGARLKLAGVADLPEEFSLLVPRAHIRTRARIVWRRSASCGVVFLAS